MEHCLTTPAPKQLAAEKVLGDLNRLVDFAETLTNRVYDRLSPVILPAPPIDPCSATETVINYPPLFQQFYDNILRVENSLLQIDEILNRLEF